MIRRFPIFTNLAGYTFDLRWQPPEEKYSSQCVLDYVPVQYVFPLLSANGVVQPLGGPLIMNLPDGKAGLCSPQLAGDDFNVTQNDTFAMHNDLLTAI